jgi:hypothetical protein
MTKDEINRPEPGSLPARISFIEQTGGSAGYYVRFKDVPEEVPSEDSLSGGEPERKYIPILQHETQEEALQAAIQYRDRRAEELGLPIQPSRGPHTEETREQMSDSHNRLGLRGLGLALSQEGGTVYPVLTVMWTGENGDQQKVSRAMASRGIGKTVEELAAYLQEHIHTETSEEELTRRGAKGAAHRLVAIARAPERDQEVRRRIESLLKRWSGERERDRAVIEAEW